jgi:hypothetical protein
MMKVPPGVFYREPLKTIPDNLLRGVGRVIVAHARLELYLTELLYDLQRTDYPIGRQVTRGDNTAEIIQAIERLVDLWNITPTEGLKHLRKDIEKARGKRNDVAHGVWMRVKPGDVRLRFMREKRMTTVGEIDRRILPQAAKVSAKRFADDAAYIHKVTQRVRALQKHVRAALKPWPYTIPSRLPRHRTRPSRDRTDKNAPAPHRP